jgi:hypothetical protein
VEGRPDHEHVEAPPGQRSEQARVRPADDPERVAHRAAERVCRAPGLRGRRVAAAVASREQQRDGDGHGAARGRDGAQLERHVGAGRARGEQRARDGERAEEDRVQHHEEGEERSGGRPAVLAGPPQAPEGERRAAGAGGGQEARGRCAGECHLGAGAQADARDGPAGDVPEQRDVAGERGDLEDNARGDPARIGVDRANQRVGEDVRDLRRRERHRGDQGRDGG